MILSFLLSFSAGVWASHSQAPVGGGSVALLDNYHRMEIPGIPLDENTKRALRFTVELGCREYAHHHSVERYESEAIASRVYFSSLGSALQMFFPGCKIANLKENSQKHSCVTFAIPPYAVTAAGKYGVGFYTQILSPIVWIQFDPSQPKASVHLREFVERNSKHFDILYLQSIQRDALADVFSLPVERGINNGISISQLVFWCVIAHTAQSAFSVTTPELYKEAIYKGLSSYFSEFELRQYVFSPKISYIVKALEFAIYTCGLPLMFYTNESKLMVKGCIPVHASFYVPPMKMGMIVNHGNRRGRGWSYVVPRGRRGDGHCRLPWH